ncbi:MAG: hypothetical protein WD794_06770 [Mycobacteriales bacterium]
MSGKPAAARVHRGFTRAYGAAPWHLLVLLGCFALTAYTVGRLLDDLPVLVRITIWLVGAAVVWDLLLGPALALADRGLQPLHRVRVRGVRALNYVRVPALLSALLLVVWAPLILQRAAPTFAVKSGLSPDPYLERWAGVTAALLVLSATAYALAVLRAGRR